MELLNIEHLSVKIKGNKGVANVVRDVSFSIEQGKVFGLVGESGCGKSVTAKTILQLHPKKITKMEGKIQFGEHDILMEKEREFRKVRGKDISMIFQDPMTCLDPLMTVGKQISEGIRYHEKVDKKTARERSVQLMQSVGITYPEKRFNQYPHEFSGGMLQRIMIAIALSCNPKLLIADEPTTALDVTIQAQILKLIRDLKEKENMSILIITHDLGVVANFCDQVGVMYAGQIVESANVSTIFKNPVHPYTRGLLKAIPNLGDMRERLDMIPGVPPRLIGEIKGCPYAPRCKYATHLCQRENPELKEQEPGHSVRCHYVDSFVEETR